MYFFNMIVNKQNKVIIENLYNSDIETLQMIQDYLGYMSIEFLFDGIFVDNN